MLIFISPLFLIPIAIGLLLAVALWQGLGAFIHRLRGPEVRFLVKEDRPEILEAIRTGYTPRLGLELSEIFPDPVTGPDIDRILTVREKLFSREFGGFFFSVNSQDLSPTEFKALALRLHLEMAFTRSYLLENSSRLWSQRAEEVWCYHTPRPLRRLNPDYYRQLLTEIKKADPTGNNSPVAA